MAKTDTPANVARDAAIRVEIPALAPMLLGTFGPDADMRALIRLPGGVVQTIATGDRIGAQQVLAVEPGAVRIAMAGDVLRLTMPGGDSTGFPEAGTAADVAPPVRPGHLATQPPPVRPRHPLQRGM